MAGAIVSLLFAFRKLQVQVQLRSKKRDKLHTFCTAINTEKAQTALLNALLVSIMNGSVSASSVCKQLEVINHEPDLQPDDAVRALELEKEASQLIELFGTCYMGQGALSCSSVSHLCSPWLLLMLTCCDRKLNSVLCTFSVADSDISRPQRLCACMHLWQSAYYQVLELLSSRALHCFSLQHWV